MKFYLSEIKTEEDLKELFIEKWNWENPEIDLVFFDFPEDLKEKIAEVNEISKREAFKIYLFNLKNIENPERKLKSYERKIINSLKSKINIDENLYIFSLNNFEYLDFVRAAGFP